MSKKVVFGLAAGILGLAGLFGGPKVYAATAESCFAYITGPAEVAITDYYGFEGGILTNPACPRTVDIPSTLGGVPVKEISARAFEAKSLAGVTIPTTVGAIRSYAFAGNLLTAVDIPSSVQIIGSGAFINNQISALDITSSTSNIGSGAFMGNRLATAVYFAGVDYAGGSVFAHNLITSVTIQPGVTRISSFTFKGNKITSVTFPSSVTSIGGDAFADNDLSIVTLPDTIEEIDGGSFRNNKLTDVALSNALTYISDSAFAGNLLTVVSVPASVVAIEPDAFAFQGSPEASKIWSYTLLGATADPADNTTFLAEVQKIWYVQLMTQNHTNPGGLVDESNAITRLDFDGDGANDNVSIGGHIIDPAPLSVKYVDHTGKQIAPSAYLVGARSTGDYMNRFMVMDNKADVFNPANYYRYGQEVTLAPLTINGYTIPAQQVTALGDNTVVTFVYTQPGSENASAPEASELAATGSSSWVWIGVAVGFVILPLGAVIVAARQAATRR